MQQSPLQQFPLALSDSNIARNRESTLLLFRFQSPHLLQDLLEEDQSPLESLQRLQWSLAVRRLGFRPGYARWTQSHRRYTTSQSSTRSHSGQHQKAGPYKWRCLQELLCLHPPRRPDSSNLVQAGFNYRTSGTNRMKECHSNESQEK